jgi:hypothetical protein
MTKPHFAAFEKALAAAQGANATMLIVIAGETRPLRWWSNAWSGQQRASVSIDGRSGWHANGTPNVAFDAMMTELAKATIQPWTLEVTVRGKAAERDAVHDAMLAAMKEARPDFAWPGDEDMERERKAFKKAEREKSKAAAAQRAVVRKTQAVAEEKRRAAVIADAKAEAVGDVAVLIEVLGKRLKDPGRLSKTMSMLKKDGFQLFSNVTDTQLEGVVKSQTEADLVYGCRLASDGKFSCCTQNLNVCGGLRGQPCKHLLVLVIGLAKAGVLPLASANDWMIATLVQQPELDREASADVFLKYRSAQAGELDWRPTETTPEDFYSY